MSETVELELTALAHGGSALGRHEGKVIFVPYAVPGERVRAEIFKSQTRWARARLLEVLEPSVHRVEPLCPYFGPGQCGGCHLQHIDYEAQAEFKRQVVIDQLERIGGLRNVEVQGIIGASHPWSYRNHTQFSVTPEGVLGFVTADAGYADLRSELGMEPRVVPVKECPVLDPLLEDLWSALDMEWPELRRLSLRCGSATGDLMAIFELDHYEDFGIEVDFPVSCVVLLADGEAVVLMGNSHFFEHVAGRDYRISAGSFFQVNTAGAEALVALVREYLLPTGRETLVDAYCGVGLFGLALADEVGRLIGIEADPSAVSDFRYNVQGVDDVEVIEDKAHMALARLGGPVDLMILDPPRSGAGKKVVAELDRLQPSRVVYVSCDPATLARDARLLVEGGFHLREVQPVDLFPQTYHVESVALFVRETG